MVHDAFFCDEASVEEPQFGSEPPGLGFASVWAYLILSDHQQDLRPRHCGVEKKTYIILIYIVICMP